MIVADYLPGHTSLVAAALGLIVLYMLKEQVFNHLDQGRFKEASDALLIWFDRRSLRLSDTRSHPARSGFLKLQERLHSPSTSSTRRSSTRWPRRNSRPRRRPPAGSGQPAPAQPVPAQPAPAAEHKEKKVEMVKCRKCGVNFPTFMHNCPNCNEPRH